MVVPQSDGYFEHQQWDEHDHVLEEDEGVETEKQLLGSPPALGDRYVTLVESINLIDNSTASMTCPIHS